MSIIPVHTRRKLPADLAALIARLPRTWVDDGLSDFPDSLLGWDISPAGTGHDCYYCTRMWPAGTMDRRHKEEGDGLIQAWTYDLLPWGVRQISHAIGFAVYEFGGMKAFNSCGVQPYNATDEQLARGLCRHGVPMPLWMQAEVA